MREAALRLIRHRMAWRRQAGLRLVLVRRVLLRQTRACGLAVAIRREPAARQAVLGEPVLWQAVLWQPVRREPVLREAVLREPVRRKPVLRQAVLRQAVRREPVLRQAVGLKTSVLLDAARLTGRAGSRHGTSQAVTRHRGTASSGQAAGLQSARHWTGLAG